MTSSYIKRFIVTLQYPNGSRLINRQLYVDFGTQETTQYYSNPVKIVELQNILHEQLHGYVIIWNNGAFLNSKSITQEQLFLENVKQVYNVNESI